MGTKIVYLECHHGISKGSLTECEECKKEERQRHDYFYKAKLEFEKEEEKRIPIYRGCGTGLGIHTCNCTGACREIIGYVELDNDE